VKDCLPWKGPHTAAGEEREEEGAAKMKHYELTHSPSPCATQGEEVEGSVGSEMEFAKKRRVGGREGVFSFVSHYTTLINRK